MRKLDARLDGAGTTPYPLAEISTTSPVPAIQSLSGRTSSFSSAQAGEPNGENNQDEPPIPTLSGEPDVEQSTPPLSKNQLKKLRKREEWEAGRDYRKAKRKEKIVQKKARKREAREHHETDSKNVLDLHNVGLVRSKRPRRQIQLPVSFVIDCGFDRLMTEKELISLGAQLTRSYSDNHKAPYQSHLLISSWEGQLKYRFDTVLDKSHKNWRGVSFLQEDFVEAANIAQDRMRQKDGGKLAGPFAPYASAAGNGVPSELLNPNITVETHPGVRETALLAETNGQSTQDTHLTTTTSESSPSQTTPNRQPPSGETIYLTSDSPHTLSILKPYSTYIIGGLVDKNRHKGLCYKTACTRGVQTAKLPISEYMQLTSRSVLATNHVVEIMIRWLECGDWGEAFMKVIPKRKGGVLKSGGGVGGNGRNDGHEQEYAEPGAEEEGEKRSEDEENRQDMSESISERSLSPE